MPESPVRSPGRVDVPGALLLSGWLVALLLPISEGSQWGWTSPRSLVLFTLAAVLALVWAWVESRTRMPLVDMHMMRRRAVWTTNLAALVFGFGMFSSFVLVPEFVELPTSTGFGFGASVTQAGIYMVPATAGMLLAARRAERAEMTFAEGSPLPRTRA